MKTMPNGWRKSSFSNDATACVEVGSFDDGSFAVRNSNFPDAGFVAYGRADLVAFVEAVKSGELTSTR
jgi:hypothetical protein